MKERKQERNKGRNHIIKETNKRRIQLEKKKKKQKKKKRKKKR